MSDEIKTETQSNPEDVFNPTLAYNSTQETFEKILDAAKVQAVYGEPIQNGDTLVVPSAEIIGMVGFGGGAGGGKDTQGSFGGGGGTGGVARVFARPVAAIVITPTSVRVRPIVDVTKVALAGLTAMGFIVAMVARMSSKNINRALED